MTANATDAPPACIVSAGFGSALVQAGAYTGAMFLLHTGFIWGTGRDIQLCLSGMGIGFVVVLIPVLLLRLKYGESGSQAMMYSFFMVFTGLPGVGAGAWAGSRPFRKRTEVGASG